jgi:hypothetical protein|nr:MAG TPA: hypothetical protein [Caudoviricetes sp.]
MAQLGNLTLENARIFFKDFSAEGRFANGKRTFCVEIPEDLVEQLQRDGWNLKSRESRVDPDAVTWFIKVEASYRARPPRVICIPSITKNRTYLTEATIASLDYAEILNVDLTINPYPWEVNGKSGVKAYLGTMYVTIQEDPLDAKYTDEESA